MSKFLHHNDKEDHDNNDYAKAIATHLIFSKDSRTKSPEKKGENAGNKHFLLFSQSFLPYQRQILSFEPYLSCFMQNYRQCFQFGRVNILPVW